MSQLVAKNRQSWTVMYDRQGANGLRRLPEWQQGFERLLA